MSKRGRRNRSSKRRKSSSSSGKQSVSPSIFQRLNKNNVGYKDDLVEKGETDCLRKENVLSGSEGEEKSDHAPPKEKRLKQDCPCRESGPTGTGEGQQGGLSVVTSVSLSDREDAHPKVLFQQSHEPSPSPDGPRDSAAPVTNVLKISCSAPHVRLEIRETLRLDARGFKTTFVLTSGGSGEVFFESECERAWGSGERAAGAAHARRGAEPPPSPPSPPFNIRPLGKRPSCEQSFGSFWDIPPPREFADPQCKTLDLLSDHLASCRIAAQSPADEEPRGLRPASPRESRSPSFPAAEERADLTASLDQLSQSDNYEPAFMRPSFSTNRSSFTKDFISSQKRRSWVRNNSIATVERRACPVPRKRRQTFPGTSPGPGALQDDFPPPYTDSFSSLFMCMLPLQTERLSRNRQRDDGFSALGAGGCLSPQGGGGRKPDSGAPGGRGGNRRPPSPFYATSSEENPEEASLLREVCARLGGSSLQDRGFGRGEDAESPDADDCCGYRADQREFADSGFDQEIGEADCLREAASQRSLAIQITPPSCSGSEEHVTASRPAALLRNGVDKDSSSGGSGGSSSSNALPVSPKQRKTSVTTMTAGDREQRVLRWGPPTHNLSVPVLQEPKAEEPKEEAVGEGTDAAAAPLTPPPPPLPAAKEEEAREGGKGGAEEVRVRVASPAGSSANTAGCVRRGSSAADRGDRHLVFRCPIDSREHLRPVGHKEQDGGSGGSGGSGGGGGSSDHWAKRRKLFKESKQWSSAGGSSITSDITEESEETRSVEVTDQDEEDRGFYTETFHSSAWIYHGDDDVPEAVHSSLATRTRTVSVRDRTVKISKGMGEYPWGFRIQFSKPIVVTEVDTNGAAEEAGLMVGDYVLAVNGIDVTSVPHSEAADLARQGPDDLTLTIGSDIARGPNTPRPACRGYLHKRTQSGLIKGWRKRWFVLRHDCCLYYYRHKRDEGRRRALSVVKLEGAEVGPDTSLGKQFVFRCRPLTGTRVFFFCATSNQEAKRWLEAMEKAVHPITQNHVWVDVTRHNSSLPPLAVKNPECLGLLHRMDRSRDTWLQHYCILKDGCLYMYSGIRATHAHGGIYLQGYTVREQQHGSRKSTIELKPPSDEFKTFHLCAENATENKRWISAIRASIRKWVHLHQALQDYMNRPPEETRM